MLVKKAAGFVLCSLRPSLGQGAFWRAEGREGKKAAFFDHLADSPFFLAARCFDSPQETSNAIVNAEFRLGEGI